MIYELRQHTPEVYGNKLPKDAEGVAISSALLSYGFVSLTSSRPHLALPAAAMALVASLLDTVVTPFFRMLNPYQFGSEVSPWLSCTFILAKTALVLTASSTLLAHAGISVSAFKVAEMVMQNTAFQMVSLSFLDSPWNQASRYLVTPFV